MNASSLAINGGTPVRTKPWRESNVASVGPEEKQAIMEVMDRGRLSLFLGVYNANPPYNFLGGPAVQALEEEMKKSVGVAHAVSVNSATSGLSAAVGALGVGFGDEVIVSPYTMSACAVAPLWYGAIPVFADIEEATGCLNPRSIRERVTPRTKAILVVHQFGIPADMDGIMAIAKEHKLKVIEDCAQAWGATYKGKSVGTIGDIGVYSLNVHKTIQSGEGGVCVTKDPELALRLQLIRNHAEACAEASHVQSLVNMVGANYRMTETQAAIALAQLKKLPSLNARRLALVQQLSDGLKKHACFTVPNPGPDRNATYYVYPLRYAPGAKGLSRKDFAAALAAEGIAFGEGYIRPLNRLPIFQQKTAFAHGYPWTAPENRDSNPDYKSPCPTADRLYEKDLLINHYICPPQDEKDIADIITAVDKIFSAHS